MSRATHLNPGAADFSSAPKSRGGRNPFLGVLDALIAQIQNGQIDRRTEREIIAQAAYYAKRNKLPFTPTLQGVVKMAQDADKMHRDHMAAMESLERTSYKPEFSGFDRASGVEF